MSREKFEEYMHAFASIASLEKKGCEIVAEDGKEFCSIGVEQGWPAIPYFELHLRLLKKILEPVFNGSAELKSFARRQIKVTEALLDFQRSALYGATSHSMKVAEYLKKVGNFVVYPWGTSNHQVYIDLWRKKDEFKVTIFDLGAGREGEDVPAIREGYYPIQRIFSSEDGLNEEFIDYVNRLATTQDEEPSLKLYNEIYGASRQVCQSCLPEIQQDTGNCVVKNLLAANRQDAIWKYGETKGTEIFKQFYLALLDAALQKAQTHAEQFLDAPLPGLNVVCNKIQNSQVDFTGATCGEITGKIGQLYEAIRAQTVIPKPVKAPVLNNPQAKQGARFHNQPQFALSGGSGRKYKFSGGYGSD